MSNSRINKRIMSGQSNNHRGSTTKSAQNGPQQRRRQQQKQEGQDNHVNVAVRCRPMSEKEVSDGHQSIVEFEGETRIVVHNVNESPSDQLGTKSGERSNYSHVYDFNAVFDFNSSQQQVYDRVCRPIVESVLAGYNGTVFAYGQTGTGKTYTMEGGGHRLAPRKSSGGKESRRPSVVAMNGQQTKEEEETAGIIPRAFRHIFDHVASQSETQFLIRASYLEIYQEEIHDLLRKDRSVKLELHERPDAGVYVKDLTSFVCKSITEIERVMRVGNQNRIVGATDMNEHSSRSHAIFMITIEQQLAASSKDDDDGGGNNNNVSSGQKVIRVGKLNLVDLAGSERQRKTNSFGQRQRESIKINLSLSALGNVINSLMRINTQQQQQSSNTADSNTFTPYRDSKLTRLLQDSLGGNAKTLMIANIGPASYNYDETINTLNYASRAKCIRNRPKLNEDPKDALLRELQLEISSLRSKLAAMEGEGGNNNNNNDSIDNNNNVEKELIELRQKLSSLEGKLLNGERRASALDHRLLQGYTLEQEQELERRRAELASQADREQAIRDELERREEAELLAKESFSSVQQEVEAKRRLIRQILLKIKAVRKELGAAQAAYRLELDELEQLQYNLQKELKLKCLIMDNFIPNDHVDQLLPRIVYDEKRSSCRLVPLELPLDHCSYSGSDDVRFEDYWWSKDSSIRPRSDSERIGETINPANMRYKYENLIEPKLELEPPNAHSTPQRLLFDATDERQAGGSPPGATDSTIQALVHEALGQHEPDIVI